MIFRHLRRLQQFQRRLGSTASTPDQCSSDSTTYGSADLAESLPLVRPRKGVPMIEVLLY